MFCDVVDSTTLAGRLDPEDFRAVMMRYHATCTTVIERYGGHRNTWGMGSWSILAGRRRTKMTRSGQSMPAWPW